MEGYDAPPLDPIDAALAHIRAEFDAGMTVMVARDSNPAAYPKYGPNADLNGICRRIVAALLNEGWTPPPDIRASDAARPA